MKIESVKGAAGVLVEMVTGGNRDGFYSDHVVNTEKSCGGKTRM